MRVYRYMRVHNVCAYIHMLGTLRILTFDVALHRLACHVNVPFNFNTARSFSRKGSTCTCMLGSFCGCNELTWLFACNQLTYRSRRLSIVAGTHTHTNTHTHKHTYSDVRQRWRKTWSFLRGIAFLTVARSISFCVLKSEPTNAVWTSVWNM